MPVDGDEGERADDKETVLLLLIGSTLPASPKTTNQLADTAAKSSRSTSSSTSRQTSKGYTKCNAVLSESEKAGLVGICVCTFNAALAWGGTHTLYQPAYILPQFQRENDN